MIFRLSQIPELSSLSLREKQQVKAISLSLLSAKSKVILAICKLALLTPLFMALAYFEGWSLLPVLLVAGLAYPLLTAPIEVQFALKNLDQALSQFKQSQK
ncbi:hypothetical protein [Pseudoalteromonas luteoviolacea]|uniref:Uncharacterized protein n=1 Tax=Pseudoalteromonas luteoviolacea S4054 TaxID=1129367 RepID=A0A0F6AFU3_9GAMM|nr:hypothetical protein [Pseudoalteromonas luteoviolacea]AOT09213.1 hypothetical protein S4054249_15770 [Pseudoalteromonas luteoviolacea]AOT14125.1 hypothetical protein S40542_15740 [Pseudoalteromonas luteoviolacea]AOT19041.1 hypothetical protein S4054_15745 [Pseudoalteromonas luteoviolacea]KKE85082.1 hypothetical protein N479_06505 [Pseudoalteromonas luteoviolacea S4054]KZN70200.1 hypothetical protein N481_01615 [Pseudoalteromonas luteoviolacea S4047-1]